MQQKLNINKIVIIFSLLFTTILVFDFTYAFFTKTVSANKIITIRTGSKYVGIYGENKNNIELNNTYTFTIENRGIVDSGYEVYLDDVEKNIDLSTVTYEVTGDITKSGKLSDLSNPNRIIFNSALSSNDRINISVRLTSTSTGEYKGKLRIKYINYVENFDYSGDSQTFIVPTTGTYKIELWGAQGGESNTKNDGSGDILSGGMGAYVSGLIKLNSKSKIYLYVGGHGENGGIKSNYLPLGGYNGGGNGATGYNSVDEINGGAGGGATDVRLANGEATDFSSLKSRLIVASGGAGRGSYQTYGNSVPGGGLIGYAGTCVEKNTSPLATGGTQLTYGMAGGAITGQYITDWAKDGTGENGLFGKGGNSCKVHGSGAGAGYYGGGGGGWVSGYVSSAASGSSFISGHDGCDSIKEESTESNIIHTGQSIHYSGYKFTDTVMIDGAGYKWTTVKQNEVVGMPSHDGLTTMTGNSGNGYAKITFIGQ